MGLSSHMFGAALAQGNLNLGSTLQLLADPFKLSDVDMVQRKLSCVRSTSRLLRIRLRISPHEISALVPSNIATGTTMPSQQPRMPRRFPILLLFELNRLGAHRPINCLQCFYRGHLAGTARPLITY